MRKSLVMVVLFGVCCFFYGPGSACDEQSKATISGGQLFIPAAAPLPCTATLGNSTSTPCTGPGRCTANATNTFAWSWFASEDVIGMGTGGCASIDSAGPGSPKCGGGAAGQIAVSGCIENW